MPDTARLARELRSARDLITWGARELARAGLHYGHGTDNAEDEAIQLVLHAAGLGYDASDAALAAELPEGARRQAIELIERRIRERKPAPYLTGIAHYGGLSFEVDERVLIPRSSILELIEAGFHPWLTEQEPARMLDLCTGSGCLAILSALAFPHARVDATDISEDALAVAAANVRRHGLTDRVQLYRADVYDGLPPAQYDLIISNPPYVGADEMATLPPEYRHEPRIALEAPEEGLAIVRRILEGALERLTDNGLLVVEVGNSEGPAYERWPDLPLTWVDFERSEGGVFIIGAQDLKQWTG
ncbi:MAG TPA: 50S ribosomal protein L3 N(5)-glutamine methyltransferase [Nevskiales bacterium]|nr:50S ribosomal protein L3 N(5)-glutamine methyltransferase [Nevskiales bacterium]